MGTSRIQLPGGNPATSGDYNFGGAADAPGLARVLRTNLDRYLNADTGNDDNDGSSGAPWQTLTPWRALLSLYTAIDACYARLHVQASTAFATLAVQWVLPLLTRGGRVIVIGEGTTAMQGTSGDVVVTADTGSDVNHVHVALWPSTDSPVGWQMQCVSGANLGERRTVATWVNNEDGSTDVFPVHRFENSGEGDQWAILRPAAELDIEDVVMGLGALPPAADNIDSGLYIVNLRLRGTPEFQSLTLYLYGAEYLSDLTLGGGGVIIGAGAVAALGNASSLPIDGVGNTASWLGASLSQIQDLISDAPAPLLILFGSLLPSISSAPGGVGPGTASGYFVGTAVLCVGGQMLVQGCNLYGLPGGGLATIQGSLGARVLVTGRPITVRATDNAPAISATDPGTVLMLVTSTLASVDGDLIRCSSRATVFVDTTSGALTGQAAGNGNAQNASGQGLIVWNDQPALTVGGAGAELLVDGNPQPNTALSGIPSVVTDVTLQSVITRRAT